MHNPKQGLSQVPLDHIYIIKCQTEWENTLFYWNIGRKLSNWTQKKKKNKNPVVEKDG